MNKKLIRITEADLHRVVRESVNKVLNEMDAVQYNQAVQQHPNLMGKVDPRTFANRARGVNAQGRQRNDDKDAMRGAAADSWNNRYGNDYSDGRRFGTTYMNALDSDGEYTIHNDNGTYDINDGNGRYYMKRTYHPQDGSQTYQGRQFDKYGKSIPSKEQDGTLQNAGIGDKSRQIARQMANGTGKYDPNNGWR